MTRSRELATAKKASARGGACVAGASAPKPKTLGMRVPVAEGRGMRVEVGWRSVVDVLDGEVEAVVGDEVVEGVVGEEEVESEVEVEVEGMEEVVGAVEEVSIREEDEDEVGKLVESVDERDVSLRTGVGVRVWDACEVEVDNVVEEDSREGVLSGHVVVEFDSAVELGGANGPGMYVLLGFGDVAGCIVMLLIRQVMTPFSLVA